MNYQGLIIGAASFLIIGILHPIVIKTEYYLTDRVWPVFLALGVISLVVSLFIQNDIICTILAVFGFSALWSVGELKEQTERVNKGWFPRNPNRKDNRVIATTGKE